MTSSIAVCYPTFNDTFTKFLSIDPCEPARIIVNSCVAIFTKMMFVFCVCVCLLSNGFQLEGFDGFS